MLQSSVKKPIFTAIFHYLSYLNPHPMASIDDIRSAAQTSLTEATIKARSHFIMSETATRQYKTLGFFVTVFSAIVGTTIFAALKSAEQQWIQIATGSISLLAAVLAAIQTFFNLNENATKNKVAANGFERIMNMLKSFLLKYDASSTATAQAQTDLAAIEDEKQKVKESSPTVPDAVYKKATQKP
jgi:hypothetical protein